MRTTFLRSVYESQARQIYHFFDSWFIVWFIRMLMLFMRLSTKAAHTPPAVLYAKPMHTTELTSSTRATCTASAAPAPKADQHDLAVGHLRPDRLHARTRHPHHMFGERLHGASCARCTAHGPCAGRSRIIISASSARAPPRPTHISGTTAKEDPGGQKRQWTSGLSMTVAVAKLTTR